VSETTMSYFHYRMLRLFKNLRTAHQDINQTDYRRNNP